MVLRLQPVVGLEDLLAPRLDLLAGAPRLLAAGLGLRGLGGDGGRGGAGAAAGGRAPGAAAASALGAMRRELDDAGAEKAVQALLHLLLRQRDHLDDLARLHHAVHPRQHVAVGGAEGHLLEAEEGIGGQVEDAVGVAQRGADDVRVLQEAHRLQDHLARGQLQRGLALEGGIGRLLQLVFAARSTRRRSGAPRARGGPARPRGARAR